MWKTPAGSGPPRGTVPCGVASAGGLQISLPMVRPRCDHLPAETLASRVGSLSLSPHLLSVSVSVGGGAEQVLTSRCQCEESRESLEGHGPGLVRSPVDSSADSRDAEGARSRCQALPRCEEHSSGAADTGPAFTEPAVWRDDRQAPEKNKVPCQVQR